MLNRRHLVCGTLLAVAVSLGVSCGNKNGPSATVTAVTVSGGGALTQPGQTIQLSAAATLSDGTSQTLTSNVTWRSDNSSVVSVSSSGLVTGVGYGSTIVRATYESVSGQIPVTLQINMSGTWSGTAADSTGLLQTIFVMVQTGSNVTGTLTYTGSAVGTGTFAGTVSTTSNVITFNTTGVGGGCQFSVAGSGSLTGTAFNGTYTGSNTCAGAMNNGVFTLARQ